MTIREQPPFSVEPGTPPNVGFAVIVCGSRGHVDAAAVSRALDAADARRRINYVIYAGAPGVAGADSLAAQWARAHGRQHEVVHAPTWEKRNERMFQSRPRAVIAFPGGLSVDDVVQRARAAGLPVWKPYG